MTQRIAVLAEQTGWHNRQLLRQLRRRHCRAETVSITACAIDTTRDPSICLPGFEGTLPDAVLVRAIPAGSFEQITFYLSILHGLERLGVPVINDARSIERTVDKAMASLMLHDAGLPTPPTWVCVEPEAGCAIIDTELRSGHALVQKPLFGSQGEGLRRIDPGPGLDELDAERYNGLYYLQRFIDSGANWHDWRVLVAGGRALAAMRREGTSWINNVAVGAQVYPAVLQPEMRRLAERAAAVLGVDYAGVDILRDKDGAWWVIEVNSIPAWRGLQSVCKTSIAGHIADVIVARLRSSPEIEAVG